MDRAILLSVSDLAISIKPFISTPVRQMEQIRTHFPTLEFANTYLIAIDLAKRLGILPILFGLETPNLAGCGPCQKVVACDTSGKHAIFLFDDETAQNVITAYARYLQELFSDEELQVGIFTAVGAIHRPGQDDNLPRCVGNYWPDYDHELTAAEPQTQYIPTVHYGWAKICMC